MDQNLIRELEVEIHSVENKMDTLEDELEKKELAPESSSEWMGLWKESVKLEAEKYQLVFPDAEIEFNNSETQFRSVRDDNEGWKLT